MISGTKTVEIADKEAKATKRTEESRIKKKMRYLYKFTLTISLLERAFSPQA